MEYCGQRSMAIDKKWIRLIAMDNDGWKWIAMVEDGYFITLNGQEKTAMEQYGQT